MKKARKCDFEYAATPYREVGLPALRAAASVLLLSVKYVRNHEKKAVASN